MKNIYQTRILKKLANLPFAIGLLFLISSLIAIGTLIEQDQSLSFYKNNYPENKPILGFLTWKVITTLNIDHIYTAWWFVGILFLFISSLCACTLTTQLPSLRTFKLWKFLGNKEQFKNLSLKDKINNGISNTLIYHCNSKHYSVFRQNKKNYAYSGILGRVAPIVVHASIVLLLVGATVGSFGGYVAQEMIPRGEVTHIQNIIKAGNLSNIPQDISYRVNDFWIAYTKESKIDQFYSDLSLLDKKGVEVKRKIIFVNEPLVYKGLTLYQTDWDIIGLKLKINNSKVVQIPFKKIIKSGKKFWFGSINLADNNNSKLSFVLNDLQGKISVYNGEGAFVQSSFLGEFFITNENSTIQFYEFITSTGLQIKSDPGISTVYASFLLLMVSVYISFLTYSQIWSVENRGSLILAGKSNRAVLFFQEEFRRMVKKTNLY